MVVETMALGTGLFANIFGNGFVGAKV